MGQKGLAINNPDQKHQLRLYQGGDSVSALQVACVLYVGVQLLLPGQDAGLNYSQASTDALETSLESLRQSDDYGLRT